MCEFSFPPGLRVANMGELGLSHVYICENGQMYDVNKGCEIFPQKRFDRIELRSYDLDIDRLRFSHKHLLGYFFKAPWRQLVVLPYRFGNPLGLSRYCVTEDGRIFSTFTWDYLQGTVSADGYMRVLVTYDSGYSCTTNLHILVAKLFIPNIQNKNEVNHLDGNKLNNCVKNLEWVWSWENIKHARDNGLRKVAISDEDIHMVCRLLEQ